MVFPVIVISPFPLVGKFSFILNYITWWALHQSVDILTLHLSWNWLYSSSSLFLYAICLASLLDILQTEALRQSPSVWGQPSSRLMRSGHSQFKVVLTLSPERQSRLIVIRWEISQLTFLQCPVHSPTHTDHKLVPVKSKTEINGGSWKRNFTFSLDLVPRPGQGRRLYIKL